MQTAPNGPTISIVDTGLPCSNCAAYCTSNFGAQFNSLELYAVPYPPGSDNDLCANFSEEVLANATPITLNPSGVTITGFYNGSENICAANYNITNYLSSLNPFPSRLAIGFRAPSGNFTSASNFSPNPIILGVFYFP